MFDLDKPKTLPEQVKELLLILLLQLIVCGIVNSVGKCAAAVLSRPLASNLALMATFSVTAAFLVMDVMSIAACALVLRDKEDPENIKPLARFVLPLTALVGCSLVVLFLWGGPAANLTASGAALAVMFAVMLLPVRSHDGKKDGEK